jgi:hypothetical protein
MSCAPRCSPDQEQPCPDDNRSDGSCDRSLVGSRRSAVIAATQREKLEQMKIEKNLYALLEKRSGRRRQSGTSGQ